ncbi:MAG: flotillin family protein [Armatimonadetes bacterium]|nr:flotillin family protein [Armatimonadota bacterium]
MTGAAIVIGVIIFFILIFLLSLPSLIYICAPNEVLIFSGGRRKDGTREYGYRLVKGGRGIRIPFLERVDRINLTNMPIDVSASNAYSKGGIPLTVQGVANVKIAGHEPVLNNAIERFLGKQREEIMAIAKATLEGSLRGVLSTMTPEQVNEDKILFAERLVHEVETDMTTLGLVVDTLKIQNVHDEVKYLDSMGRKRGAEVISSARIAEAKAKAESIIRSAENREQEQRAVIQGQIETAKADAEKRLVDATTQRAAVVAEELSVVAAEVAKARAEVNVQTARYDQVRNKLDAEVVQPAKASAEAAQAKAKAQYANLIADGQARGDALRAMAEAWEAAGPSAREMMLSQKLEPLIRAIGDSISTTPVEQLTIVSGGSKGGSQMGALVNMATQAKEVFGIDVVDKIKNLGNPNPINVNVSSPAPVNPHLPPPEEPPKK